MRLKFDCVNGILPGVESLAAGWVDGSNHSLLRLVIVNVEKFGRCDGFTLMGSARTDILHNMGLPQAEVGPGGELRGDPGTRAGDGRLGPSEPEDAKISVFIVTQQVC